VGPKQAARGGKDNGIMAVFRGNKHSAQMDDGDGYFDLDNLEYAAEFRENERANLHLARDCRRRGGEFHVIKETGLGCRTKGALRSIARTEYFPSREDVIRLYGEEHCGGHYLCQRRPRLGPLAPVQF